MQLHKLSCRSMSLHAVPWAYMKFMSLHEVPWAYMKFHELVCSSFLCLSSSQEFWSACFCLSFLWLFFLMFRVHTHNWHLIKHGHVKQCVSLIMSGTRLMFRTVMNAWNWRMKIFVPDSYLLNTWLYWCRHLSELTPWIHQNAGTMEHHGFLVIEVPHLCLETPMYAL